MALIEQYPHYLFAILSGGESAQDKNGNWITPEPTVVYVSRCREEPPGRGTKLQVAGGAFHSFSAVVQLPKGGKKVAVGTTVIVSNDASCEDIRIQGETLGFDEGQLHSMLYL
jgi:hypothetical protein